MTPPVRSKAKQQDVLKFEVDQEKRGASAAQEKRRSSCLQKLSLSGASTHPDPISGIYFLITPLLFDLIQIFFRRGV